MPCDVLTCVAWALWATLILWIVVRREDPRTWSAWEWAALAICTLALAR